MSISRPIVRMAAVYLLAITMPFVATAAEGDIATVEAVVGAPVLHRQGRDTIVKPGMALRRSDRLTTRERTRTRVAFTNKSELLVGEKTSIFIRDYAHSKNNEHGRLLIDVASGSLQFTPTPNTDVSRHKVYIRLPEGGLSGLGATYWTGPVGGRRMVLLLDGRVEVRNPAGSVTLTDPDTAATLVSSNVAPGPPQAIARRDKRRALAMTVVP